jgi:hypothetical protein
MLGRSPLDLSALVAGLVELLLPQAPVALSVRAQTPRVEPLAA